ncbi:MAG: hypothetical protein ACJ8AD_03145 [Gemmatimonadaceae bacterium]
MTVQWSAAVRNARLDAWETAIGTAAIIRIYTGTVPSPDTSAARTGTLLWSKTLASDWSAAASGGVKSLSSTPLSAAAVAAGTAGYYTIFASDGTTVHEQGTITATGGGGDMTIDNTSIANGQTVQITGFQKTEAGA